MTSTHLEPLKAILGKENISENKTDLLIYSYDSSQIKGKAELVLWPKTTQEIQKIIRYANRFNLPITPRGGGTSLVGGAVPQDSIIIDLSKMDRILKQKDNTITVEPGIIIADLNTHLKSKNLTFPVIPSSDSIATIGGMISTDAAGNRAIRYGRTSDWIKEIELVTGTGNIIKTTDIKEFSGSEGTLAIITGATLKLTRLPKQVSLSTYTFRTEEELTEKVRQSIKEKDILAIEYTDPLTSSLMGKDPAYHLFIEYESNRGHHKTQDSIDNAWKTRKGIGPILSSVGHAHIEDPLIPIEFIPAFLKWLRKEQIPNFGHIGYGIIHCRIRPDYNLKTFYDAVKNNNGTVSGEHGIGLTKKEYITEKQKNTLKEKKQKYDKNNILNRGKVI